ncbi:MAG: hypothetical protein KDA32_10230 [Phycisphaerales bacterium]|nr:hypothetical protein [Phycisphaerales bacterium]
MTEGRAELAVCAAVDADVRSHAELRLDLSPPCAELRPVKRHAAPDYGDEPAAWFEPQQRLLDVPCAESRAVAVNAATGCRERRVHHDGVVDAIRRQNVVEPLRIECCRSESLKLQQRAPTRVDFVRIDARAGEPCEARDVSRPRTGF